MGLRRARWGRAEVIPLTGAKILVTGVTGQVARPVATALAEHNDVWGIARFRSRRARAALVEAGVTCTEADLEVADLSGLPDDFTHLLNFAVAHTQDWGRDLAVGADSAGLLMAHCRRAEAVLHCSTTGVYRPDGAHRLVETDPLGDSHAAIGLTTYSITKIAAEAVVRQAARVWDLPTTIARLNVPYGDDTGWPAMHLEMMLAGQPIDLLADDPCSYNPIHADDILGQLPALLGAASVPATVVNWAGPDVVSVEQWCRHLGDLTGITPTFHRTEAALPGVAVDTTRLDAIAGAATVEWREGMGRLVATLHPGLVRGPAG